MTTRPPVDTPIKYGNASLFWVEYPSGLVDLTRTTHHPATDGTAKITDPPPLSPGQLDVRIDSEGRRRSVRISAAASAYVIIDMQKMSALWEDRTCLDSYLKENGITTLLFAGVNADQCVLGTMVDAYFRGYDVILVTDTTATTSPAGGLENVVYNAGRSYGFQTDSKRVNGAVSTK